MLSEWICVPAKLSGHLVTGTHLIRYSIAYLHSSVSTIEINDLLWDILPTIFLRDHFLHGLHQLCTLAGINLASRNEEKLKRIQQMLVMENYLDLNLVPNSSMSLCKKKFIVVSTMFKEFLILFEKKSTCKLLYPDPVTEKIVEFSINILKV